MLISMKAVCYTSVTKLRIETCTPTRLPGATTLVCVADLGLCSGDYRAGQRRFFNHGLHKHIHSDS
jgi:hypothetical protein